MSGKPTHASVLLNKEQVRQAMIRRRSNMDSKDRARANHAIQHWILSGWRSSWRSVLMYAHQNGEVATIPMIRQLIRRGQRLCVPAFDRRMNRYYPSELKHFEKEMERGLFGILEPKVSVRRPIPVSELDVIFLPGLAFDRQGNRLGYGHGYFDQICRFARAIKIGLAYEFQIMDAIPMEEHDIPADGIVTEKGFTLCRKSM